MYTPDYDTFANRAAEGNLVPVYRGILADMETPVSAFLKLREAGNGHAFLLESVAGGENIARYSYLAINPYKTFSSRGRTVTITERATEANGVPPPTPSLKGGEENVTTIELPADEDPLDELKRQLAAYQFVPMPGGSDFRGAL
jgi:anthranilate synthase component 1